MIRMLRRGRENPVRDTRALVELLWREQALELLARHGAARGLLRSPREAVWDRLCETVRGTTIAAAVLAQLKARAALRAASPRS